jgi:hypothetical protein
LEQIILLDNWHIIAGAYFFQILGILLISRPTWVTEKILKKFEMSEKEYEKHSIILGTFSLIFGTIYSMKHQILIKTEIPDYLFFYNNNFNF